MTDRRFHRVVAMPAASLLLEQLGDTLTAVKRCDNLHDSDLGDVLGKSADRAVAARRGEADISLTSFLRGVAQWGSSFGDPLLAPVQYRLMPSAASGADDRAAPRVLTEALMKLIVAIENDGEIDDHELNGARAEIIALGTLADDLRHRLSQARR